MPQAMGAMAMGPHAQTASPCFFYAPGPAVAQPHEPAYTPEATQDLAESLLGTSISIQKRQARGEAALRQRLASLPLNVAAQRSLVRALSDERDGQIRAAILAPNVIEMTPSAYLSTMIAVERSGTKAAKTEEGKLAMIFSAEAAKLAAAESTPGAIEATRAGFDPALPQRSQHAQAPGFRHSVGNVLMPTTGTAQKLALDRGSAQFAITDSTTGEHLSADLAVVDRC